MSNELRALYYNNYPLQDDDDHHHNQTQNFSSFANSSANYDYMSFTDHCLQPRVDYNSPVNAFGLSPNSSSEVFSSIEGDQNPVDHVGDISGSGNQIPATLNSPTLSCSSFEAGHVKDDLDGSKKDNREPPKGLEDGGRNFTPKKLSKEKKKGEKKEKEPRFAFMTKSEVDHLEDGYRWRKYGQKAVKNSSYPRSYYRCTTKNCIVKKRVERSFQDPSIVITTYEGKHNHPIPATLRGNLAASNYNYMFPRPSYPSNAMPGQSCFPQDHMLAQMPPQNPNYHYQLPDYGLLNDINIPNTVFVKPEA